MPNCDRLLLFSSAPMYDESFLGYLLRLTELNCLSTLSWLLQIAKIKKYLQSKLSFAFNPTLDLLPLAQVTGVGEVELAALQYRPVSLSQQFVKNYLVFGLPVQQYMIRLRHPKICTACLREKSYTRRIWDLAPITTCVIHKCLLLDECPNCGKRISWARC